MDLTIQTNNGQPMSAGYIKAKWDAFKNAAFNSKDEAQKNVVVEGVVNKDQIVIFK